MSVHSAGLADDIDALRSVLSRLLREERDLNRLVTGAARLTTSIVQAERLRHQVTSEHQEEEGAYP
ncbi:MAG: hypothetical protein IT335_08680 [Thermomicrobiales bacterium]|nr:hypothetical protein [Thermomicrobiales bacterium]